MEENEISIESILGEYKPETTTGYITNSEGQVEQYEYVPDGLAGVNFGWIAQALVIIILIYSVCRIIGGLITHVK